jgi:hypothetical protein
MDSQNIPAITAQRLCQVHVLLISREAVKQYHSSMRLCARRQQEYAHQPFAV